jgi:hypothetical protein
MSETEQAAEAVEEQEAAPEEPAAEAPADAEQPAAEAAPADEEAPAAGEPGAEVDPNPELDAAVEAAQEELAEEAIPVPVGPVAGQRQAKVFLCDRGHRTIALWSEPSACHARPTRHGGECGRQLYPISELPEQVQKALNPLKASKKASKG